MLPEILNVIVEGGGNTLVPVTPSTTFRDVSGCVRDPGDPLPIILEQSPLGARVVAGWERPLELLRLWGNMRAQVSYNASFSLSQHLHEDSYCNPLNEADSKRRSRTPDPSLSNYEKIDPWELYDLRDELKGINDIVDDSKRFLSNSKFIKQNRNRSRENSLPNVTRNDIYNGKFDDRQKQSAPSFSRLTHSDENETNCTNNDSHHQWDSFNSHIGNQRSPPRREPIVGNQGKKQVENLLLESKMASTNGVTFRRGSLPLRSLPIRKSTQELPLPAPPPASPSIANERYTPSPYKKYKATASLHSKNKRPVHPPPFQNAIKKSNQSYGNFRSNCLTNYDVPFIVDRNNKLQDNGNYVNTYPNGDINRTNHKVNGGLAYNADIEMAPHTFTNGSIQNKRQPKLSCVSPSTHRQFDLDCQSENYSYGNAIHSGGLNLQVDVPKELIKENKSNKQTFSFLPKVFSPKSRHTQSENTNIPKQAVVDSKNVANDNKKGKFWFQSKSTKLVTSAPDILSTNKNDSSESMNMSNSNEVQNYKKSLDFRENDKLPNNQNCENISQTQQTQNETNEKTLKKHMTYFPDKKNIFRSSFITNHSNKNASSSQHLPQYLNKSQKTNIQNSSKNQNNNKNKRIPLSVAFQDETTSSSVSTLSSSTPLLDQLTGVSSSNESAVSPADCLSTTGALRRSRLQKRSMKADHRRSYSDPAVEFNKKNDRISRQQTRRRRHSGEGDASNAAMKELQTTVPQIPAGCHMTVGELREMASRQQQQIETQQQLLVARETRLKFLKQQEGRSAQAALEADRLRRLKERVEAQEGKLRRLRALRGQVDCSMMTAASLSSDLEAMRHLFSEKEKELVDAAAKVEQLTRQLEEVRAGRAATNSGPPTTNTAMHLQQQELDKLRRELLYRNSVRRESSARMARQRSALATRRAEVARVDQRIAEIQQRLQRKRFLNQQLASQISAATQAKQAQLKAVQQKSIRDSATATSPDGVADITQQQTHATAEDILQFERGSQDPKYQTLPYNTKFSGSRGGPNAPQTGEGDVSPSSTGCLQTRTVHSIPTYAPAKGVAAVPQTGVSAPTVRTTYSHARTAIATASQQLPFTESAISQQQQSTSSLLPSQFPTPKFSPTEDVNVSAQQKTTNVITSKTTPGLNWSVQTRPTAHPVSHSAGKDIENVRAAGFPAGTASLGVVSCKGKAEESDQKLDPTGGSKSSKPILPPKPLPPPRQKGDIMVSSNDAIHLAGSAPTTRHTTRPYTIRYGNLGAMASSIAHDQVNKLTSDGLMQQTHKDLIESLQSADSSSHQSTLESKELGKDNLESAEKVHISINRRIEMPPDFLFPEDATPPSDLLGGVPTEKQSSPAVSPESSFDAIDKSVPSFIEEQVSLNNYNFNNKNLVNTRIGSHETLQSDDGNVANTELNESFSEPSKEDAEVTEEEESTEGSTSSGVGTTDSTSHVVRRSKKGNLKSASSSGQSRAPRRVSFDPLALLLDASLEGELELVRRTAAEVADVSAANDEGITALHNAICAGHIDIVTFLVTFGCDVNAQDADGWTPLHCAASCNNVSMVRFLVERGACVLATTLSDHETAAEKCEQDEEGYDGCSQYLYSVQEKLGIMNGGIVYAVFDYASQNEDELSVECGDALTVLRRGDEYEREWWWVDMEKQQQHGYVPRNILGLYPRVKNIFKET